MSEKTIVNIPLNRTEGDLEIRVQLEDRRVTDAWCSGLMYRGFENFLVGRGPLDGLVITPRICGICSTAHLSAAVAALDMVTSVPVPPAALLVRNLALATEHLQSDVRQTFLMFMPDAVNPAYQVSPLFAEAVRRYEPLKGEVVVEVIKETKKVLEIIALFGGAWPHSSYMVPGGITCALTRVEIQQCLHHLARYREWYEDRILGCPIERWLAVRTASNLDEWLEESPRHTHSEVGFLVRFARDVGLDRVSGGPMRFLSFGSLPLPQGSTARAPQSDGRLVPAGFRHETSVAPLDQTKVSEHVGYSWFEGYEGGRHPAEGITCPHATGDEGQKYSWAKAPRYDGMSAETGPLAEMMVAGNPLFSSLVQRDGTTPLVRQLARLTRGSLLIPAMEAWCRELTAEEPYYKSPGPVPDGQGFGLVQASRGALGHWLTIHNDKIAHYQIITPSGWNFSPRDTDGNRGPVEEALVGVELKDVDNPLEVEHVIRSFDPCLVCTVHMVRANRTVSRRRVGLLR